MLGVLLSAALCGGILYYFTQQYKEEHRSGFEGSVLTLYGDSIIWQGTVYWYPYLMQEFNFGHVWNLGVGGRRISGRDGSCMDDQIAQIDPESDIIVIGGGTNDWAQNVELGKVNSENTDEFCGALNYLCQRLTEKFPNARLVMMTPPYGKYPDWKEFDKDKYGLKNDRGLMIVDYGQAMAEVAEYYGIPVADVSANAGWNDWNIEEYVKNDGAYLHPNDEGMIRVGKILIETLKSIEPIRLTKEWEGK